MTRLFLLEIVLTGVAFTLLSFGIDSKSLTKHLERRLSRIEKRPLLATFGVVIIAIVLRVACLSFFPPPQPRIHDEFSYLLAADTFAHGRLTNPTHPQWPFFESFHVIHVPSYASMYPPAQGLVLAAGRIIGNNAWFGVLVSTALMCGTLCWMLQAWLPGRWAILGGVIAVFRIALFSYWGNSYWGGSVAAIGGLLVLGSIPRLSKKNASVVYFLTFGFGILILANSRPYEGLLLCFAALLAGLTMYLKFRPPLTNLLTSKWLVVVFMLIVGLSAMAFYNWRVTGNAILLPYKVNQQQYALAQAFLWQTRPDNIEYRHEVMRNFYEHYLRLAVRARSSIGGFVNLVSEKLTRAWAFYLGLILSIPLIALRKAALDRRIRFLALTALFAIPGFLVETWFHAHYAAPFTGIFYVLMLQSMRHVRFSRSLSPQTRYAVFLTIPTVIIVMTVPAVMTFPAPVQGRGFGLWCCNPNGESVRSRLVNQLQASGGRHLVFVEYTRDHDADLDDEWVYNAADIDSSPVVFARHIDPTKDLQLIQYFSDRQVWRLVVADAPVKFERYKSR